MHDALIMGSDNFGAAIASRVSEDQNRIVLLLEAGPDYLALTETPLDLNKAHDNSYEKHDWNLRYNPYQQQELPFPTGR